MAASSMRSSLCTWLWLWLCSTCSLWFFSMASESLLSPSLAPHFSLYKSKHWHHRHHPPHQQHADAISGAPSASPSPAPSAGRAYPRFSALPPSAAGATAGAPPWRSSPALSPVAGVIAEAPSFVDASAGSSPSSAMSPPASSSKPLPAIAAAPSAAAPLPPPASLMNTSNGAPLDPAQLEALRLLGIHVGEHPCTSPALHDVVLCDKGSPERHVMALHMELCGRDAVMEGEAMEKLATSLKALSFVDCPMLPVRMPGQLVKSLMSLTCIASLGATASAAEEPALPGAWLGRFRNLSELAVADVQVNASGLAGVIAKMKHLKELRFSNTNLTGSLPVNTWPANLTTLDLALNAISGPLPASLTKLSLLTELDLSHNQLAGHIPNTFHKLKKLQKLSLTSNSLSGPFPSSLSNLSSSLIYLDLSNNKLHGPLPYALNHMKSLRYLDLSHNHFSGPLPFNQTFLDKLNTLKVRGNLGICYDHSILSSPFLEGVPACDSSGLPIVPSTLSPSQPPEDAFAPSEAQFAGASPSHQHRGPRIIVAAVAITLVVIFVFIIVVVLISKCRGRKY